MGEGWSDFFALTIQSFLHGREKVVVGDWVVNGAGGIRRAPYDDQYPFHYGQLVDFPEVHDIGEIWCAALMKMTRLIRSTLGDDNSGYRLAWQLVVDALKVTPTNPTFLDGRDAILRALDDLLTVGRISRGCSSPCASRNLAGVCRLWDGSRRLQCGCRRPGGRCRQYPTSRPRCLIQHSYIPGRMEEERLRPPCESASPAERQCRTAGARFTAARVLGRGRRRA
jgi:Fungalysin metallopeptidase (M36)